MRTTPKRAGVIALCLAAALSITGCSALAIDAAGSSTSGPQQNGNTSAAPGQQTSAAACEIVNAEWGRALDSWPGIQHPKREPGTRMDFAKAKTEHEALIADLQKIADKVEVPDVRGILDSTIDVHQRYADEIWPLSNSIPEGYVANPEDPKNKISILGKKQAAYDKEMDEAGLKRYDLCGSVQNGQTGSQACEIVNGDWVDAGLAFNSAASEISYGQVAEGVKNGKSALHQIRMVLSKVTVPEVLGELESLYDAYQVYYDEGFLTAKTEEELKKLSLDELNKLIEEGDKLFKTWDSALTAGEGRLKSYCNSVE